MTAERRIRVAVLGSTGSIGVSTLDVLARHPERFDIVALTAHTNVTRLREQCLAHRPVFAVVAAAADAAKLSEELRSAGCAYMEIGRASCRERV